MLRKNYLLLTCLILVHFIRTSYSAEHCKPSFCGNIHTISYPFRLKDDPKGCGDPRYEISCENNTTASIYLDSREYHVRGINYENHTIRVADTSIKKNDTCSFPLYSPNWYKLNYSICPYSIGTPWPITIISCPFGSKDSIFTETDECVHRVRHTYIKVGHFNASDLRDMCKISVVAMTSFPFQDENNASLAEIHDSLLYGFELSWGECTRCHLLKWQVSCELVLFLGYRAGTYIGERIIHLLHSVYQLSSIACFNLVFIGMFAMAYFGLRFMIGVSFLLCNLQTSKASFVDV